MKNLSFFTLVIILFTSTVAMGITSEEALKNIHKRGTVKFRPFSVTLTTKVVMGTVKQDDSGTVYYSPSGCVKVEMYKSKLEFCNCGDTSWMKSANGDVTRSLNKNNPLVMLNSKGTMPDFGAFIEKNGGNLVETPGDSAVTYEIQAAMDGKNMQTVRLTFDTRQWLLRKVLMPGGQMGNMESFYQYTQFNGQPMLREVRTMIGTMGIMMYSYSNYKEIKDKKKEFFRIF
jgi:hypothetical protein